MSGSRSSPGYLFLCSPRTRKEVLQRRVFGLPLNDLERMKQKIGPETWLFLWDFSAKILHGIFFPEGECRANIEATAFGGKFKAQVRFKSRQVMAKQVQLTAQRLVAGPLTSDTVQQFIQYLNANEAISIPADFYEPNRATLLPAPVSQYALAYVFACNDQQEVAILKYRVFLGREIKLLYFQQRIGPKTKLFLYNISTKRCQGVFFLAGRPGLSLHPDCLDGRFPAQVPFGLNADLCIAQPPPREYSTGELNENDLSQLLAALTLAPTRPPPPIPPQQDTTRPQPAVQDVCFQTEDSDEDDIREMRHELIAALRTGNIKIMPTSEKVVRKKDLKNMRIEDRLSFLAFNQAILKEDQVSKDRIEAQRLQALFQKEKTTPQSLAAAVEDDTTRKFLNAEERRRTKTELRKKQDSEMQREVEDQRQVEARMNAKFEKELEVEEKKRLQKKQSLESEARKNQPPQLDKSVLVHRALCFLESDFGPGTWVWTSCQDLGDEHQQYQGPISELTLLKFKADPRGYSLACFLLDASTENKVGPFRLTQSYLHGDQFHIDQDAAACELILLDPAWSIYPKAEVRNRLSAHFDKTNQARSMTAWLELLLPRTVSLVGPGRRVTVDQPSSLEINRKKEFVISDVRLQALSLKNTPEALRYRLEETTSIHFCVASAVFLPMYALVAISEPTTNDWGQTNLWRTLDDWLKAEDIDDIRMVCAMRAKIENEVADWWQSSTRNENYRSVIELAFKNHCLGPHHEIAIAALSAITRANVGVAYSVITNWRKYFEKVNVAVVALALSGTMKSNEDFPYDIWPAAQLSVFLRIAAKHCPFPQHLTVEEHAVLLQYTALAAICAAQGSSKVAAGLSRTTLFCLEWVLQSARYDAHFTICPPSASRLLSAAIHCAVKSRPSLNDEIDPVAQLDGTVTWVLDALELKLEKVDHWKDAIEGAICEDDSFVLSRLILKRPDIAQEHMLVRLALKHKAITCLEILARRLPETLVQIRNTQVSELCFLYRRGDIAVRLDPILLQHGVLEEATDPMLMIELLYHSESPLDDNSLDLLLRMLKRQGAIAPKIVPLSALVYILPTESKLSLDVLEAFLRQEATKDAYTPNNLDSSVLDRLRGTTCLCEAIFSDKYEFVPLLISTVNEIGQNGDAAIHVALEKSRDPKRQSAALQSLLDAARAQKPSLMINVHIEGRDHKKPSELCTNALAKSKFSEIERHYKECKKIERRAQERFKRKGRQGLDEPTNTSEETKRVDAPIAEDSPAGMSSDEVDGPDFPSGIDPIRAFADMSVDDQRLELRRLLDETKMELLDAVYLPEEAMELELDTVDEDEVNGDIDDSENSDEEEADDDEFDDELSTRPPASSTVVSGGRHDDAVEDEFDISFDDCTWEVEITEFVLHWLKKNSKKQAHLNRLLLKRLRELAEGRWNDAKHRKALQGTDDTVKLYEAKLSKGARILWELAISFSERRTSSAGKAVYTESIRVWKIVTRHDDISSEVRKVCEAHRRGRGCYLKRTLSTKAQAYESQQSNREGRTFIPHIYSEEEVATNDTSANRPQAVAQPLLEKVVVESYPPAAIEKNQYTLLKFYDISKSIAEAILSRNDMTALTKEEMQAFDIPFKVTDAEYKVITYDGLDDEGHRHSTLLIGRSGTGKTTCALFKMVEKYRSYWATTSLDSPLIATVERGMSSSDTGYHHLRQLFITKSSVLRGEVEKVFHTIVNSKVRDVTGHKLSSSSRKRFGVEDIGRFDRIADARFPIFLTADELLTLLDRTLPGEPFLANRESSFSEEAGRISSLAGYFEESDSDSDLENTPFSGPSTAKSTDGKATRQKKKKKVHRPREMDFNEFCTHWDTSIKSSSTNLHCSLVYTEIKSYIKGSLEAMRSEHGELSQDEYLAIGRKRSLMSIKERKQVYAMYLKYKELCRKIGRWDPGDLAHSIFKRMEAHRGSHGIVIDALFGDEIQDFTQAELSILLMLVNNHQHVFFCGDSAQTIARGVGFRFTDLKLLWTELFGHTALVENINTNEAAARSNKYNKIRVQPKLLKLTNNYRSHEGCLRLAANVIGMVYQLFPQGIDKLPPDRGVLNGPKPVLLETRKAQDLLVLLLGNMRSTAAIEFGAHQVILVRSDEVRRNLPAELKLALVMTIYEAKGLEFDDVLLYNFFQDSPIKKEFQVLTKFRNALDLGGHERFAQNPYAAVIDDESTDTKAIRSKEFDPDRDKLLESELKQLYTAITRSRVNVWIYDESKEKREPFFEVCKAHKLVEVVSSIRRAGNDENDSGLFAKSTTAAEWLKRGREFLNRAKEEPENTTKKGLLRVASDCLRRADSPKWAARAEAEVLSIDAIEIETNRRGAVNKAPSELQVHNAWMSAAHAALMCGATRNAARQLKMCKQYEMAAELAEAIAALRFRSGNAEEDGEYFYNQAAKNYKKSDRIIDAARCFELGASYKEAYELLRRAKQYLPALDVWAKMTQNSTDDGDAASYKELVYLAVKEHARAGQNAELQRALDLLQPAERIAFLESQPNFLNELCRSLCQNKQHAKAAQLATFNGNFTQGAKMLLDGKVTLATLLSFQLSTLSILIGDARPGSELEPTPTDPDDEDAIEAVVVIQEASDTRRSIIEKSFEQCRLLAQENDLDEVYAEATLRLARYRNDFALMLQAAHAYNELLASIGETDTKRFNSIERSTGITLKAIECIRDLYLFNGKIHEAFKSIVETLPSLFTTAKRLMLGKRSRSRFERAQDTAVLQSCGFTRIPGNDDRLEFVSIDARARSIAGVTNASLENLMKLNIEDSPSTAGKVRVDAPLIFVRLGRELMVAVAVVEWQRLLQWETRTDIESIVAAYKEAKSMHLASDLLLASVDSLTEVCNDSDDWDVASQVRGISGLSQSELALIRDVVPAKVHLLIRQIFLDHLTLIDATAPKLQDSIRAVRIALSDSQLGPAAAAFIEPYIKEITMKIETITVDTEQRLVLDDCLRITQLLLLKASFQQAENPAKSAHQVLLTSLSKHTKSHRAALKKNRDLKNSQRAGNLRRGQQKHKANFGCALESDEVIDKALANTPASPQALQALRQYAHVAEDLTTAIIRLHAMPTPSANPIAEIAFICNKIADFFQCLPQSSLVSSRSAISYIFGLQSTLSLAFLGALAPVCGVDQAASSSAGRAMTHFSRSDTNNASKLTLLLVDTDIELYLKSPLASSTASCLTKLEQSRHFILDASVSTHEELKHLTRKVLVSLEQTMHTVYGVFTDEIATGIKLASHTNVSRYRRYAMRMFWTIAVNAHLFKQAEVWSGSSLDQPEPDSLNDSPRLGRHALTLANSLATIEKSDAAASPRAAFGLLQSLASECGTNIMYVSDGIVTTGVSVITTPPVCISSGRLYRAVYTEALRARGLTEAEKVDEVVVPEIKFEAAASRIASLLRGWKARRKKQASRETGEEFTKQGQEVPVADSDLGPFAKAARAGAEARAEHEAELREVWRSQFVLLLTAVRDERDRSRLDTLFQKEILKTTIELLGALNELTTSLNSLRRDFAKQSQMLKETIGVKLDLIETHYTVIYGTVQGLLNEEDATSLSDRLSGWKNSKKGKAKLSDATAMIQETKQWILSRKEMYTSTVLESTGKKKTSMNMNTSMKKEKSHLSNQRKQHAASVLLGVLEDEEDDDEVLDAILGTPPAPGPNAQTTSGRRRRNRRGAIAREFTAGFGGRKKRGGNKIS